nr:hypothetical protein [Kibdelosporangium sp. MJ126-NF4]CEL19693.1 hypothetical protein [Kibdelosporangium sp. MJ126-NF4]
MAAAVPFRLDRRYDVDQASDGVSRYGAYLAQHRGLFFDSAEEELTQERLEFAAAAWRVASSPIMSPSFVKPHPRVQSAEVMWDEYGRMAVDVVIATDQEPPLPRELRFKARGWERDALSPGPWYDPQDPRHLTVLPTLLIRVPITPDVVVEPRYINGNPATTVAQDAVQGMCDVLNRTVSGVLDGLD